jgi:hypothetical protein
MFLRAPKDDGEDTRTPGHNKITKTLSNLILIVLE